MGKFAIYYGTANHKIDVTGLALQRCMVNNAIIIPSKDDNRAAIFSDPLPGILKSIFIEMHDKITEYNDASQLHITIQTPMDQSFNILQQKLQVHHSKLQIMHGSFHDEYPEQLLALDFLKGDEKVLEIGGNIGRNSLIIASILSNQKNLVVLESDDEIAKQLTENRDINKMEFHIENSALSKRKLIQNKWVTKCSDVLEPEWKNVNILSLDQLKEKYKIDFDTLILDCEGAFYYILVDMPEILDNVKLLIMENDYSVLDHYKYVESMLQSRGFHLTKQVGGGWGPCSNNFFEVWSKSSSQRPKIIDCFIFYNELDLLNYRLHVLEDVVEYFVIVESTHTFRGKEKPLFFNENKHMFEKFKDKIIHVIVEDFPHKQDTNVTNCSPWDNEGHQRNAIARGLQRVDVHDDDFIIISDVDEIPDPTTLQHIQNGVFQANALVLEMGVYYYNLNTKFQNLWHYPKILSHSKYKSLDTTCDKIRYMHFPIVRRGGWHLSYFGDSQFIRNKIQAFSHQEYNKEDYTDVAKISQRMNDCRDLFERSNAPQKLSIQENDYLPKDYDVYLTKYYS